MSRPDVTASPVGFRSGAHSIRKYCHGRVCPVECKDLANENSQSRGAAQPERVIMFNKAGKAPIRQASRAQPMLEFQKKNRPS